MRSANEISAMVLKAARGAGLSLGCAEELARVAPCFAAHNALAQVVDVLGLPNERPNYVGGFVSEGHPVRAALAWRDLRAAGLDVTLDSNAPAGFVARMCESQAPAGPFHVTEEVWGQLGVFADVMLVPESDASRLAGAGAGLSDND